MKNTVLGIFLLYTLLFFACSSSKRALKQGHYYKATVEAIKHLRTSPGSKKSQEVLLQAYPLAQENSMRIIQNAREANLSGKYATIADEYLMLNELADEIYTCPKALELIPHPNQYSRELREILPLAAEESYVIGSRLLRENTMRDAREAYFAFAKTDRYVEGYRDVKEKMEQALYMATLKVIVQQPRTPKSYQLSATFFYNNLMAELSRMGKDRFIRFYTYAEAKEEGLSRPDQLLVLNFEDFSIGRMRESRNSSELVRDSVLVGTTSVNGTKQNVYGTVKARFIAYRREVISEGVLSAQIVDASNKRVLEHRNFPGRFVWFNEWATYKGDERALTKKELRMAETEPLMPPPHQDLFIEFTKPIFDQTIRFVRDYYRGM